MLALTLLLACNTPSTDDADAPIDLGPRVDPDVSTYVPPDYVPADPQRLIFLGDSITAGEGVNDWDVLYKEVLQENIRKWKGFNDVDLESAYPELADVIDVSRPGATTDTLISEQLTRLERALPSPASGETIVVFTIGGNDLQAALIPTIDSQALAMEVLGRVEEIVTWLQDPGRFPDGVRIYATNVYEPSDGVGQHYSCFYGISYADKVHVLEDYNTDLRNLGEAMGFSVVDLRGHFLGHGMNHADSGTPHFDAQDPTLWLLDDCIHPNKRGHHEVRRLFYSAILDEPLMWRLPE